MRNPKRYSIEISHDLGRTWSHFYRAPRTRSLRRARKHWWKWVQHEWEFATDLPMFRIFDEHEGKTVE